MLFAISNERSWSLLSSGGLLKLGIHKSAWVSLCFTMLGTDLDILDILDDFGVHQSVQVKHPWCLATSLASRGPLGPWGMRIQSPSSGTCSPSSPRSPQLGFVRVVRKVVGDVQWENVAGWKLIFLFLSQMLHVWNIYQHLPHKWPKCR